MKDSGVEWIGEIPESWIISKVKYSSAFINGFAFDSNQLSIDGKYPVIRIGDFQNNQINYNIANKIDDNSNLENYQILKNDILIAMSGATVGKIAYVSKVDSISYINQRVGIIRNDNPNFSSKYVYYSLLSPEFIKYIYYTSFGSAQPNVSGDTIMDYYITFSSLEQQEKTALFLDLKTSGIKSIIDNLNNQIGKLKEYKKALITKCVTKGLDPNVPLKDSGIDWIGNVPEKWTIAKGRSLFNQRSTKGNSIVLQLLSPTQKYGVVPQDVYEELSGMAAVKLQEGADLSLLKTIHKGDFCISLRSFQGGFEYSSYEGVVSPAYHVFYPIVEIDDAYYKYMFKSDLFIFKMRSYPLTLRDGKNISFSDFGDTLIPYPPVEEQHKIGLYLDKKCSEIDALISSKQQQIDKLNEYQKSLIYEYVTGKKEVI